MKPVLLFVHGAGACGKTWHFQTRFFKDSIAADLPGHSDGTGKGTIEEYVEEMKRFCDGEGLRNIVMVGHSMGGAIAQSFALEHPEYLKAIVLACTGARLRVIPEILEATKTDYARAVELIVELAFSSKSTGQMKMIVKEEMMKIRPEVTHGDFEACDRFDVTNRLRQIRLPTLVICGQDDQLTPVKYSEYLKDNIANSKLEIIADAGHMVMLEKPNEFNEKLEKFVKELDEQLTS